MYRTERVAIVVPAFNEQEHIADTLLGIPSFVDAVFVVDDGSTDRTAEIVRDYVTDHSQPARLSAPKSGHDTTRDTEDTIPRVEFIQHQANRGVGAAIVTGYKCSLAAGMDITAVMAGDNQMEPEWLPGLLDEVVDGRADYAKGTRQTRLTHLRGMSPWRVLGNIVLRCLTAFASGDAHITDPQHGYTAISRDALQCLELDAVYTNYGYCNDLIVRLLAQGRRIVEVPMPSMYHGEVSKIRYHRYIPRVSMLLLRLFVWRITGRLERAPQAAAISKWKESME